MRPVPLVLALLALLLGTPTNALEPVLDTGDGELIRMNLPFQPITPTSAELERWADAPHWDFANPSVTITFEQTPLNCPSRDLDDGRAVRIILKRVGASGAEYWVAAESPCPG